MRTMEVDVKVLGTKAGFTVTNKDAVIILFKDDKRIMDGSFDRDSSAFWFTINESGDTAFEEVSDILDYGIKNFA